MNGRGGNEEIWKYLYFLTSWTSLVSTGFSLSWKMCFGISSSSLITLNSAIDFMFCKLFHFRKLVLIPYIFLREMVTKDLLAMHKGILKGKHLKINSFFLTKSYGNSYDNFMQLFFLRDSEMKTEGQP